MAIINSKAAAGMGAITNIINIVREISLADHYFSIGILRRQTIFLSTIVLNAETWVNLTENNIEELEKIDRILLKRIFEAPSSTSIKSLYLESGSIPIRYLIKAKRLMFLHYLLNREDKELISQVLYAQIEQPIKNDWFSTVLKDLKLFGLDYLEIKDIKSIKKEQCKKLIKDNCKDIALKYLLEGNEDKTKLKNLKYYQLSIQSYLTSSSISTRMKKYLFRFRTKMTNVGHNFGNKVKCPLCKLGNDDQEHLFKCVIIKINCEELYKNTEEN